MRIPQYAAYILILGSINGKLAAEGGWELRMTGLPPLPEPLSGAVVDSQTIWIFANGSAYRSSNFGAVWLSAGRPDDSLASTTGNGHLAAWDDLNAVVATSWGGIYRTRNGGTSWSRVFHDPSVTRFFNRLEMFEGGVGYAMGDAPDESSSAAFLRTVDSGWTWTQVNHNLPNGSLQLEGPTTDFIDPQVGWSIQQRPGSGLFKTTNGGVSWERLESAPGAYSVAFVDDSIGFVTNFDGIFRTTDGGLSWSHVHQSNQWLFVGCAPNGKRIWYGGFQFQSFVYASDDSGDTWYEQSTGAPSQSAIWASSFLDENVGLLVGSGVVLTTTTGGNQGVNVGTEKEIPRIYSMRQNHPNPFNPSTTIRYTLPDKSHVTLTVFNTLGQQVATLVEGEREAGYHEARFDGSQFASGVYLYQFRAEAFVRVRKMILVK